MHMHSGEMQRTFDYSKQQTFQQNILQTRQALQMSREVDWPRRGCQLNDHQGVFAIPGTRKGVYNLGTTHLSNYKNTSYTVSV